MCRKIIENGLVSLDLGRNCICQAASVVAVNGKLTSEIVKCEEGKRALTHVDSVQIYIMLFDWIMGVDCVWLCLRIRGSNTQHDNVNRGTKQWARPPRPQSQPHFSAAHTHSSHHLKMWAFNYKMHEVQANERVSEWKRKENKWESIAIGAITKNQWMANA